MCLFFQSLSSSSLLVGRGSVPHRIFSSSHARVQTNNLSLYITNGIEIYQIIILILSTSYVFPTVIRPSWAGPIVFCFQLVLVSNSCRCSWCRLMPPRGYEFMSELDGELFFRGREDHICDYYSKLWNFPAGGNDWRRRKLPMFWCWKTSKQKYIVVKYFFR